MYFFLAFKTATFAPELQVSTVSQTSSVDGQPAKGFVEKPKAQKRAH